MNIFPEIQKKTSKLSSSKKSLKIKYFYFSSELNVYDLSSMKYPIIEKGDKTETLNDNETR